MDLPAIRIHDPVSPGIPEEDDMDVSVEVSYVPVPVLPPPSPPGFERFSWPSAVEGPGGDTSPFNFSAELPGWFPRGCVGQSRDPPSLPISPILSVTPDDSLVPNVGSSRDESDTPSVDDHLPDAQEENLPDAQAGSSSPDVSRPMPVSPPEVVSDLPDCLTSHAVRRSPGLVPRLRLAQEGPFLSERSSSSLRCFEDGCAFRNTTYRPSDYARPTGEFGVLLHHPRFLEWIGIPESASLLEMGPGM